MTQELIYTSATSGLKPGSKGFCTVAATSGIAPRTVTLLESLSGYRHTFPPTNTPNPGNPTAWMHLHTPNGESLLSRVGDAGLDYSGRSNKMAHHLLLSAEEQTEPGPASMLQAAGNFSSTWEEPPRWLTPRKLTTGTLSAGATPPIPAKTWQAIGGDAGWAGVLAQAALSPAKPDCYLIYENGQENQILDLFGEAIALVPSSHRWQISFNTFFSKLPPGMACQWRGIRKGSPEHRLVPPHDRVIRIDLTSTLPPAPAGRLVQYARTGRLDSEAPANLLPSQQPVPEPLDVADILLRPPTRKRTLSVSPSPLDGQPPVLDLQTTRRSGTQSSTKAVAVTTCLLLAIIAGGGYAMMRMARPLADNKSSPVSSRENTTSDLTNQPPSELAVAPASPLIAESVDSPGFPNEKTQSVSTLAPEQTADPANDAGVTASIGPLPMKEVVEQRVPDRETREFEKGPLDAPEQTVPESNEPESTPAHLRYLMEPNQWTGLRKIGDQWSGDQRSYTHSFTHPLPNQVSAMTLGSNGSMKTDSKYKYIPASQTLFWGEPDAGPLQPASKVVQFQPDQLVLQINYAERIKDRFLLAQSDEGWTLYTLYGAVTPGSGMDQRLQIPIQIDEQNRTFQTIRLGSINPELLSIAELRFVTSEPNQWRWMKTVRGIELNRLLGPSDDTDPQQTRMSLKVDLEIGDGSNLLFSGELKSPRSEPTEKKPNMNGKRLKKERLDRRSLETARSDLAGDRIEVDLVSDFRVEGESFTTVLSQFTIVFE